LCRVSFSPQPMPSSAALSSSLWWRCSSHRCCIGSFTDFTWSSKETPTPPLKTKPLPPPPLYPPLRHATLASDQAPRRRGAVRPGCSYREARGVRHYRSNQNGRSIAIAPVSLQTFSCPDVRRQHHGPVGARPLSIYS